MHYASSVSDSLGLGPWPFARSGYHVPLASTDIMGSAKQDYREAVEWVRAQGWRVDEERDGYPMAFCKCGKHHRSIHLTPSNPRYYQQLRNWVKRQDCEQKEGGDQ